MEDCLFLDSTKRDGYPISIRHKFRLRIKDVTQGFQKKSIHLSKFVGVNYLYNIEDEGYINNRLQITLGGTTQTAITITPGHYSLATLAAAITAASATLTLTQSSVTGLLTLTDSGGLTIGFVNSELNKPLLNMLGFIDISKTGTGGSITADIAPNLIKHDLIFLKCSNSEGFFDGFGNQQTNAIATIPIGVVADWGDAFEYEPTSFNWSEIDVQSPSFEFVDKWGFPVKRIGEFFLQFIIQS